MSKLYAVLALVLIAACSGPDAPPDPDRPPDRARPRDNIEALERLEAIPVDCETTAECPTGSHCDPETAQCDWECLSDTDCGTGSGQVCSDDGTCVAASHKALESLANASADSDACQAIDPAVRRAALLELAASPQPPACDTDLDCPCGAYCNESATCEVDCLTEDPPPELTCLAGEACTALGRCAESTNAPPPPYELTIDMAPLAVTAHTSAAPAVVEVQISVTATTTDVLDAESPAVVELGFGELSNLDPAAPPPLTPKVKCAPTAAFATSCTIDGGWTFDLAGGALTSQPKTVWVEIPQSATERGWTLEARSEAADLPAKVAVQADPAAIPPHSPGHYTGTLSWLTLSDDTVVLDVDAVVTSTHVAFTESSRVLFPDGQIVMSRQFEVPPGELADDFPPNPSGPFYRTIVPWLVGAGGATLDVRVSFTATHYDAVTGRFTGTLSVARADATEEVTFSLERVDTVEPATCSTSCAADSYCNATMHVCLPGTGPGGDRISATSSFNTVVPSADLASWATVLPALIASDPTNLTGTGVAGIERAYCYESGATNGPAQFGVSTVRQTNSSDLSCTRGTDAPYPQRTFELLNRTTENAPGTEAGTGFDLFEECLQDFNVTSASANLLGPRECVSVPRFMLALNANVVGGVGHPLGRDGRRLVSQLVRQWLSANAYVATTAVKDQAYDAALAADGDVPAYTRLGNAVDLVERGLRVLLDPRVRPQWVDGLYDRATRGSAEISPDYRRPLRPSSRWTFNTACPECDAERSSIDLATPEASGGQIVMTGELPTLWSSATNLPDTTSFTISFAASFDAFTSGCLGVEPMTLFQIAAPSGPGRLFVDVYPDNSNANTSAATLQIVLSDQYGHRVSFPPISRVDPSVPGWGLLAIVADGPNNVYRLYQGKPDGQATLVAEATHDSSPPAWPGHGSIGLPTDVPLPNSCTSWDLNHLNDGADVHTSSYKEPTETRDWLCQGSQCRCSQTSCFPPGQGYCDTRAAQKRDALLATIPTAPAAARNALGVTGTLVDQHTEEWNYETHQLDTVDVFHCDLAITAMPQAPVLTQKPVCGSPISCSGYTATGITIDELAIWDYPVSQLEVAAMARRYAGTPTSESLPAADEPLPSADHGEPLAVHLLETAAADLDLVAAYIDAERALMFDGCVSSEAAEALTRTVDRVGRGLRLTAVLDGAAHQLMVSSEPGIDTRRFFAAQRTLTARRSQVMVALRRAATCTNSLGISEDDLPLYTGSDVDPDAKFYASTQFLAARARDEIADAASELAQAQSAYTQQRQTAYQVDLEAIAPNTGGQTLRQQRIANLQNDFETQLRQACGVPSGTATLLGPLQAGTMTADDCFIKTELSTCAGEADKPLRDVRASCLRGDLGARVLAIQTAALDSDNALHSHDRAQESYDSQMQFCARRQEFNDETSQIMTAHRLYMAELRSTRLGLGFLQTIYQGILLVATKGQSGAGAGPIGVALTDVENQMADEQELYEQVLQERRGTEEIMACYHTADLQKFAIDAADDVIVRAAKDIEVAQFHLDDDKATVTALVAQATGQLALEQRIDRAPPALHYWLDQHIAAFDRHMENARRLTYLAVLSYEYESQQSTDLRGKVLVASIPDALDASLDVVENNTPPLAGVLGYSANNRALTVSLRDQILELDERTTATTLPAGVPKTDPIAALRAYLLSESSKIYGSNHELLGRGFRFAIRPGGQTSNSCAERIWRITETIQLENPPGDLEHQLLLFQSNAFGSQSCDPDQRDSVTISRVTPSNNLLTGEPSSFIRPSPYTAIFVDGPLNLSRTQLAELPAGSTPGFAAGLAGRGLYAEYVLVFPEETFTDAVLAGLNDVMFRFDIVEVASAAL